MKIQRGQQYVYLILHPSETASDFELISLGGNYDSNINLWVFPLSEESALIEYASLKNKEQDTVKCEDDTDRMCYRSLTESCNSSSDESINESSSEEEIDESDMPESVKLAMRKRFHRSSSPPRKKTRCS